MPQRLPELSVRLVRADERARFDAELDAHHWLGHHLFGETMRYVATDPDGDWLALVGFGSAALACRPRDAYVAWSDEARWRRLRYIAGNQRFCVLPEGRQANLASAVLARALARLSEDYQARWGHPVLVVETFVDPSRHLGTCYVAAGFARLGETLGYGRRNGRYELGAAPLKGLRGDRDDTAGVAGLVHTVPLLAEVEPPVLGEVAVAPQCA